MKSILQRDQKYRKFESRFERKAAKEKQPKKDAEQITEGIKSKENASQATTATQKQKKK